MEKAEKTVCITPFAEARSTLEALAAYLKAQAESPGAAAEETETYLRQLCPEMLNTLYCVMRAGQELEGDGMRCAAKTADAEIMRWTDTDGISLVREPGRQRAEKDRMRERAVLMDAISSHAVDLPECILRFLETYKGPDGTRSVEVIKACEDSAVIDGRAWTAGDEALATDIGGEDFMRLITWVHELFDPRTSISPCGTSGSARDLFAEKTGIDVTINQMKDAMLLCGFRPGDESEADWSYRV